ncbi:succinate dehydrogenase/fumarate reductase flavoprotein, partial [Auriscalpium vulgare]
MALSTQDGGVGLMRAHREALTRAGVEVRFGTRAVGLVREAGGARAVTGVVVETADGRETLAGRAVVLAAGGYEASAELRERHLGAGWSEARVRGTPYNTGDGIAIATAIGAARAGDWAGCHSTCWDAHAARDAGDRTLGNQYTKSGYPLGLMLNARGARFVDEGADFRNFTYAAYGRALLAQPGGVAFQVYDARVAMWLREEEYGDAVVRTVRADSLEGLARALAADGLEDPDALVQTVHAYNAASATPEAHGRWDPAVKDELATRGIAPPKSNWALPLDTPPFAAVKVACGITFTFGGLAVDARTAGVRDDAGACIPGLFCAGEMVGGLWYGNYPGGSGLTAGAVLGRIAGKQAAERAACQSIQDIEKTPLPSPCSFVDIL